MRHPALHCPQNQHKPTPYWSRSTAHFHGTAAAGTELLCCSAEGGAAEPLTGTGWRSTSAMASWWRATSLERCACSTRASATCPSRISSSASCPACLSCTAPGPSPRMWSTRATSSWGLPCLILFPLLLPLPPRCALRPPNVDGGLLLLTIVCPVCVLSVYMLRFVTAVPASDIASTATGTPSSSSAAASATSMACRFSRTSFKRDQYLWVRSSADCTSDSSSDAAMAAAGVMTLSTRSDRWYW
mmetsp:Transcript_30825/g.68284  ORF Transcript_30825/g.68284 Transcript_30825/m.68284 type:complete len:244 (-) Transcript_30825:852-1583(-)